MPKKTNAEKRRQKRLLFRRRLHRRFRHRSFLPNLFTLGNAFFGFCAIVLAAEHDYFASSHCILLGGVLLDQADGRVARLFESTSELGVQLDSLADAITFCCAPAFLMYAKNLHLWGMLGVVPCALFLLAGLFRLARFNIFSQEQSVYFCGLPTGISGCLITLAALHQPPFAGVREEIFYGTLLIAVAALMVSRLAFPTFKNWRVPYFKVVVPFVALVAFAVTFVFGFYEALLLFITLYVGAGLAYALGMALKERIKNE